MQFIRREKREAHTYNTYFVFFQSSPKPLDSPRTTFLQSINFSMVLVSMKLSCYVFIHISLKKMIDSNLTITTLRKVLLSISAKF